MQKTDKRIGIFGGTFDPVHNGHMIVAEVIREEYDLDLVVFVPSGFPPHKDAMEVTAAEHRFNMVSCAVKTNPCFTVSRIELERSGYTYTIDTLMRFREIYGDNAGLYFIAGADAIMDISTWKEPEKIFTICDFIAVQRPGFEKDALLKRMRYLKERYGAGISIVKAPVIGISSTEIRERVRDNRTIRYLVPDCVEVYIYNNSLYNFA